MAKVTTHNFARNLSSYFLEEANRNLTISQENLMELYFNGSLDATQAFLVFNLFHDRFIEKGETISLKGEETIFGTIPLGKAIHAIIALLFVFIFITQTCIEKDNSTIVFQICTASLGFNLALDAAEQGLWVSATVYHWIHDLSIYFIVTKALIAVGFSESPSLFNVFKEKKRMHKHPKTDIALNIFFVLLSWITGSFFTQTTCQLFFCLYLGYLLFRVHNYLHNFVLSDMLKPFPMLNLNSSAFALFFVVACMEFPTV